MSNLSSGFIDLATFDDIESFLYAGHQAITYFIRQHKKASWFTQVPVELTNKTGTADFGQSWSVSVSRAGDYLLHAWLEVTTPVITAKECIAAPTGVLVNGATMIQGTYNITYDGAAGGVITPGMVVSGTNITVGSKIVSHYYTTGASAGVITIDTPLLATLADNAAITITKLDFKNFWAKNFMHNLIDECTVTFNDLIAHKITGEGLDFWAEFNVPAGKRAAYDRMIGAGVEVPQESGKGFYFLHGLDASVARTLTLPLPFFFSRESGLALPTAAIPYNDMRLNFKFKAFTDLLSHWNPSTRVPSTYSAAVDTASLKAITSPKVYANYAIVSNDERQLMGATPRDIVIEQNQLAPIQALKNVSAEHPYDIRFSHAIKSLMFAIRDIYPGSTAYALGAGATGGVGGDGKYSCYHNRTVNEASELLGVFARTSPIDSAKLLYENTTRLDMPSHYYTHVNPFFHSDTIPDEPGLHFYSFALDHTSADPMGSTNFGKLTNVSLSIKPNGTQPTGSQVIIGAINHNVIRVSGGAVGFPVL